MQINEVITKRRLDKRIAKQNLDSNLVRTIRNSNVLSIPRQYNIAIVESSAHNPFLMNQDIVYRSKSIGDRYPNNHDKAYALFEWCSENINYDFDKYYKKQTGYKSSIDVRKLGKGVCGESAFLYIVMARIAGLDSYYVHVEKDHNKKIVNHACAGVVTDTEILVDIAYKEFDIKHLEYKRIDDDEAIARFRRWNNES